MFVKLGNVIVNTDKIKAIYPCTETYIKRDENDIRNTMIVFDDKDYTYSDLTYDQVCEIIINSPA